MTDPEEQGRMLMKSSKRKEMRSFLKFSHKYFKGQFVPLLVLSLFFTGRCKEKKNEISLLKLPGDAGNGCFVFLIQ